MNTFIENCIRRICGPIVPKDKDITKFATVEEAIRAWEEEPLCKKRGYRIIRGADGNPVESEKDGENIFALIVNGNRLQYQSEGPMRSFRELVDDLQVLHDTNNGVFNVTYEILGMRKILGAPLGEGHQGFLYGFEIKPKEEIHRP